jgi:hypothetical protein
MLCPCLLSSSRNKRKELFVPWVELATGDLLNQDVEVIVNDWNRNIPKWLLLPLCVSGAIEKRAVYQPFREVAKHGPIPSGDAVLTMLADCLSKVSFT